MSKSFRATRGVRAALRTGPPSITAGSLALGGAVLFGGTAYFSYRYATAHVALRDQEAPAEPGESFRVFDKIANKYDEAIGQEEAALWYGMMRRWLLREAYGDVLEVSVGTGRNFQYYDLGQGIKSLTFTDLSPQMLLRAEDKFFDELHLGHKHPNVRTTFCLADAHCLVKPAIGHKTPPVAAGANGAREAEPAASSSPWWSHWRRRRGAADAPPSAQAGSSSAAQGDGAAGEAGETPPAASAGEPAPQKEMAGLHASGLMNFFRILAPPPSPSSSSAKPVDSLAKQVEAAQVADSQKQIAEAQPPAAGSRPQAHAGVALPADAHDIGADGQQALKEMARVCKPNGKVLLLEHGRSYYDWLNGRLDASAADHQRKWGCLWNRDILAVVQQAGLQVEKVTRWHFGTSYYIVARPCRGP